VQHDAPLRGVVNKQAKGKACDALNSEQTDKVLVEHDNTKINKKELWTTNCNI
jgi:hypothetical protein